MNKINRSSIILIFIFFSCSNVCGQVAKYKNKALASLSLELILSLSLSFFLGAFIMFLIKKKKVEKIISEKDKKVKKLKFELDELKKKNNPVPSSMRDRGNTGGGVPDYTNNIQEPISPQIYPELIIQSETSTTESIQLKEYKTIYFASPNENGSFPDVKKSFDYIEDVHNYKLLINDGIYGTLKFINHHKSYTTALLSPHQYIKPVFEETNDFTSKTISIKMVDNGNWHLENNIWVIKNKAKIKYE